MMNLNVPPVGAPGASVPPSFVMPTPVPAPAPVMAPMPAFGNNDGDDDDEDPHADHGVGGPGFAGNRLNIQA